MGTKLNINSGKSLVILLLSSNISNGNAVVDTQEYLVILRDLE